MTISVLYTFSYRACCFIYSITTPVILNLLIYAYAISSFVLMVKFIKRFMTYMMFLFWHISNIGKNNMPGMPGMEIQMNHFAPLIYV